MPKTAILNDNNSYTKNNLGNCRTKKQKKHMSFVNFYKILYEENYMKILKKYCIIMFALSLIMNTFSGHVALAANSSKVEKVLSYQKEIKSLDKLLTRAKNGVDELKTKRGKTFDLNNSTHGNVKVKNISTSQLLKETQLSNGSKQEEYVINVFTLSTSDTQTLSTSDAQTLSMSYTKTNEETKDGCTLVTRIYVTYDFIEGGKDALKLRSSYASVTGSVSPTKLVMGNRVYEGWETDKSYIETNEWLNPTGAYYLISPYSGYITTYSSYILAENTVYLPNGSNFSVSVAVGPKDLNYGFDQQDPL